MDSSNPAFRKNTFAFESSDVGTMTMSGAINKAGILFVIMMIGAFLGWNAESSTLLYGGAIGALIAAVVTIWKTHLAPYTSPVYAFLEGLFVGSLSVVYDYKYPGIAANAMTLTFGILGLMLLCYRTGLLRATPMFTRAVVLATAGLAIVYLVNFVMSFFGTSIPFIHSTGTVGIIFSLIASGVAAMNLIIDFDMFEKAAAGRSPKYMEWYCGFALLVTLVWIYVEMLRLLSKLSKR